MRAASAPRKSDAQNSHLFQLRRKSETANFSEFWVHSNNRGSLTGSSAASRCELGITPLCSRKHVAHIAEFANRSIQPNCLPQMGQFVVTSRASRCDDPRSYGATAAPNGARLR